MDRNEIRTKVMSIMREVFSDQALDLDDAATAQDVPVWDSIAHINLMMAIEKEFAISLAAREIRSMRNVGDLINLVHKKIASSAVPPVAASGG